jgi:hypothetical protein
MARPPLSEWFQIMTHAQKAMWMSAICGVKVTEANVKDAKRRGAGPEKLTGCITELTDDDRRFLTTWFAFRGIVPEAFDMVWRLCAPGSMAAGELDDLFEDAAGNEISSEDEQVVAREKYTQAPRVDAGAENFGF